MELAFRFPNVIAGFRIPRAISGFQSPGFWIPQAKSFRNLDYLTFTWDETFITLRSEHRIVPQKTWVSENFGPISGDFG